MEVMHQMLVPAELESQPLDVRHEEEHIVVTPHDRVLLTSL